RAASGRCRGGAKARRIRGEPRPREVFPVAGRGARRRPVPEHPGEVAMSATLPLAAPQSSGHGAAATARPVPAHHAGRPRGLILTVGFGIGGAEQLVLTTAPRLQRDGFEVTV